MDELLSQAAGIVFVVDSVDFLPNVRTASEYMYDILTKASVVKEKDSVTTPVQQGGQSYCTFKGFNPKTAGERNQQTLCFEDSAVFSSFYE